MSDAMSLLDNLAVELTRAMDQVSELRLAIGSPIVMVDAFSPEAADALKRAAEDGPLITWMPPQSKDSKTVARVRRIVSLWNSTPENNHRDADSADCMQALTIAVGRPDNYCPLCGRDGDECEVWGSA